MAILYEQDIDSPTSDILTIQWRVPHIGDNSMRVYAYLYQIYRKLHVYGLSVYLMTFDLVSILVKFPHELVRLPND